MEDTSTPTRRARTGTTTRRRRAVATLLVVGVAWAAVACVPTSTLKRPDEPVVLTGAELPDLVGVAPSAIVAFAHTLVDGVAGWVQIPVQVDERKTVDFGEQPASNATPGVDGTVYGTTAIGQTTSAYADPGTFVGPDSDPTFDADDELVFMSGDAGGTLAKGVPPEPAGVVPGSGVRITLNDTLDAMRGIVYLFETDGSLDPAAGRDYVDYDFNLASGAYKTTYKRADGPNPETSAVTTDTYRIGLTDRWIEDQWRIDAGPATGADVLDGVKARFALTTCGRSNATFADGEGAFLTNTDGPVRAIRSYVGANSGPLTQRTHLFYRTSTETVTDLRVHAIPGIMDFVDYSTAAIGMTYRNSANTGGVTIDGSADAVSTALPSWELVTGAPGSIMTAGVVETTGVVPPGSTLDDIVDGFYRDELNSTVQQCWGDAHFLGASGLAFVAGIPNTDPRLTPPPADLQATRHVRFTPPGATAADAAVWADALATPLTRAIAPYAPPP